LNDGGKGAWRKALRVDVAGVQNLFEQADLIVGVQNGEVGLQPHRFGVAAQNARGQGVKGAHPPAFDRGAQHGADAFLHFARGFVGERHRKQLARPGAALQQNVRKARGQHARFAGACTRQHQHRAVGGLNRFALAFVKRI